jgi:hypothetical protein
VDRALVHIDTGDSRIRNLVTETLAYVAISRPRYDARIFTDDAGELIRSVLTRNVSRSIHQPVPHRPDPLRRSIGLTARREYMYSMTRKRGYSTRPAQARR